MSKLGAELANLNIQLAGAVSVAIAYVDADDLVPDGVVFGIAHELNCYMDAHPEARDAYAAQWAREWVPVPAVGGEAYFPAPSAPSILSPAARARSSSETRQLQPVR